MLPHPLFRQLLLFTLLLAGPAGAWAQAKGKTAPTIILFVGNSFFHGKYPPVLRYNTDSVRNELVRTPEPARAPGWGGTPGIFKKLTDQAGLAYEVHLEAINGQSLQYHYDNALAVIQQPRWDVVVLQEHSTWPLPVRRTGKPELFREYAVRLEQAVHAANPAARVFLYQTWPRADLHYPPEVPYSGLPIDSMTRDLHAAYYGVLGLDSRLAGVVPVGDAWLRAVQTGVAVRNPYAPEGGKLDLWGEDHYHPSTWGAYLNACVLFAELTGRNPQMLGGREQAAAELGIAPADAVRLQRIAQEQVSRARHVPHKAPAAGK
ncbi:DUF4886 domain-containing protein [Hymenobacter persicinus]|uniref:PEP-CTERM sorting domain-containing protein n=1 Tax=Hymenobacter persicinus TaxID=2025506 RepID=A0A4V1ZAH2_9BACT|nr:DUF4886 domain-containing protein [Hymenobacter persicinus]RYU78104.1 PEP-CTERM sorting domain-containing protein [Hymenobacter persicinus]